MSVTSVTLANKGTYTQTVAPTKVGYNASKLTSRVAPTADTYVSYFYIPMPAQLAERTVLSAYVDVVMESQAGSRSLTLSRHAKPATPYTEMHANNRPGTLSGTTLKTITQVGTTTTWRFDVTADIASIAAGGLYYGFKLTSTHTVSWKLNQWQSATPPKLTVVLSEDSTAPTGIRPAGVTSLAKPVLQWNAPDGILSAQAQIDTVGDNFSVPVFDTGTVAVTTGELDLAATAYAGLADGASIIVRVRQTTDAGVSEWSDAITITRDAYTTLSIANPTATTTDPTPAVTWTFIGQVRWQVTTSVNGVTVHDTGQMTGGDNSFTPPVGATAAGQVISFRVRAWDNAVRTSSPGDLGYVEATKATTYNPGAAAPVSALTVTQNGVKPWPTLSWVRTSGLPDEWLIVRNGKIINRIPAFDVVDVLSYVDWTCPPNTPVTYTVVPVENGAAGLSVSPVAFQSSVTGAWLVDPGTGVHFSINGESLPDYTESSVVYYPVGGSKPVKRTFALRGLEGPVTGFLDDYDGRTRAQQETDLYIIKGAPSLVCRFIAADINIPVVVANLTSSASPDQSIGDQIVKAVSYVVYQDGELPFPEVTP